MRRKKYKTPSLFQFSLPKRRAIKPKPIPKPKRMIPISKVRSLYKVKVSVRRGGKPRKHHPWFHVAGGLLGSTKPSTRTVVELSEKLTWADKRDLEKRLGRWGFMERSKGFRSYWEKVASEPYAKVDTKEQKAKLKQQVKGYWHGRIDPFAKINVEFGEY